MENELYSAWKMYRRFGTNYEALFRMITVRVYSYPKRNSRCTEEDCADFLISFYPRISRLIERYEEKGKDFEAYLFSCLRWHMKSFVKTKIKEARKSRLALQEEFFARETFCEGPDCLHEEPPSWNDGSGRTGPFRVRTEDGISRGSGRKKLILIALKGALYLDDSAIKSLSEVSGLHEEILFHIVSVLRFTMRGKVERIKKLHERRCRNYFRIRCLLDERDRCDSEEDRRCLDDLILKERKKWEKTSRELSSVPKSPAHGEIARALGIPKGSVDSGLFYMKKYL